MWNEIDNFTARRTETNNVLLLRHCREEIRLPLCCCIKSHLLLQKQLQRNYYAYDYQILNHHWDSLNLECRTTFAAGTERLDNDDTMSNMMFKQCIIMVGYDQISDVIATFIPKNVPDDPQNTLL